MSASGASLALQGSSGGQYALQASTVLQTWTNLLTTPNLPSTFLDTEAAGLLYRFYRLRWQWLGHMSSIAQARFGGPVSLAQKAAAKRLERPFYVTRDGLGKPIDSLFA